MRYLTQKMFIVLIFSRWVTRPCVEDFVGSGSEGGAPPWTAPQQRWRAHPLCVLVFLSQPYGILGIIKLNLAAAKFIIA